MCACMYARVHLRMLTCHKVPLRQGHNGRFIWIYASDYDLFYTCGKFVGSLESTMRNSQKSARCSRLHWAPVHSLWNVLTSCLLSCSGMQPPSSLHSHSDGSSETSASILRRKCIYTFSVGWLSNKFCLQCTWSDPIAPAWSWLRRTCYTFQDPWSVMYIYEVFESAVCVYIIHTCIHLYVIVMLSHFLLSLRPCMSQVRHMNRQTWTEWMEAGAAVTSKPSYSSIRGFTCADTHTCSKLNVHKHA